ncbi:MAG: hypothetical protein A49_27700 [Methyloceanibacter sp.]|nr:MAG: hypothetical protein A49_27700 [Methyloceanibacter sp.]
MASWISSAATDESTPPRQPAYDAPLAHLGADALHLRLAELGHAPVAAAAADFAHEGLDQRGAFRRMHHLRVELHAIELAGIVGDGREGRAGRDAHGAEAGWQLGDAVAMAHPHLRALALLEHAVEKRRLVDDLQLGAAEFAFVPRFHLSAERRHHGLFAVADAEHGNAGREQRLRRLWRAAFVDRGGTAGQDDGFGARGGKRGLRLVERDDFRINARLADAACDELGHLTAEVDDQHTIFSVLCGISIHIRHFLFYWPVVIAGLSSRPDFSSEERVPCGFAGRRTTCKGGSA